MSPFIRNISYFHIYGILTAIFFMHSLEAYMKYNGLTHNRQNWIYESVCW